MKNIILIFSAILILSACEETVNNPNLPFREELVILAILEPGKAIDNISITKTLHPLSDYIMDSALVKDLNVSEESKAVIIANNTEYPLEYSTLRKKYKVQNLIPEIGKTYDLLIRWKGQTITARTIVPDTITIESYTFKKEKKDWGYGYTEEVITLFAHFKPLRNSVYNGVVVSEWDNYKYMGEYLYRIIDTNKTGRLVLPVTSWWGDRLDTNDFKSDLSDYFCLIDSYDHQFYNYFKTRYEGNEPDMLSTSGINIQGNINNGIGLFVGRTSIKRKIFFN